MQMIKQIKSPVNGLISYDQFEQYIVGQIANLQQQTLNQNTQFRIHFVEHKKQDYLLHDNGILKIYYAKDIKLYLVLDQNSDSIKIYNCNMRIVARYQPSKQKHNFRIPKIKYFDFNQFTNKIGLVLSNKTFELINLMSFLNNPKQQFENNIFDYVLFSVPQNLVHLEFIQMTNKWVGISDENKVYLMNPQQSRQSNQQFLREIKLWNDPKQELLITNVLELVPISTICFVAGNEMIFFNEKLNEKKCKNYKHGSKIKKIKYNDETNQFYIQGDEKGILTLTLQRNTNAFIFDKIMLDDCILDFEVFSYFGTILITDDDNNISLYDIKTQFCYHKAPYSHIVKKQKAPIKILRTGKVEFLIFQSYMISMIQQKKAIQKQVEYIINPYLHYNPLKEQIFISVNNQIISFYLLTGQIKRIYSNDHFFMPKYQYFFINQTSDIMLVDSENNLLLVERRNKDKDKDQLPPNFKHIDIQMLKTVHYDQKNNLIYLLGKKQIVEIKSKQKIFHIQRQLILQNFEDISFSNYNPEKKKINFATHNNFIMSLNAQDFSLDKKLKFIFPSLNATQPTLIVDFYFSSEFELLIVLTNSNELILIETINFNILGYVDLLQGVTYKQVNIDFKFTKMCINQSKNHSKSKVDSKIEIILVTQDGHFMQISLIDFIQKYFESSIKVLSNNNKNNLSLIAVKTNKNKYVLDNNNVQDLKILFDSASSQRINIRNCSKFSRRHTKQIVAVKKVTNEDSLTITISKEGEIKISDDSAKGEIICETKLPSFAIKEWNMRKIQKKKISTIVEEVKQILKGINSRYCQKNDTPKQLLRRIRKNKQVYNDFKKIDHNQPIPIQIQAKNIEKIVNNRLFFETDAWKREQKSTDMKFRTQRRFSKSSDNFENVKKITEHPWRKNKEFIELFSDAASQHKYRKKMPSDLLNLRRSLDMLPNKKQNPQEEIMKILPQLNLYSFEKEIDCC